MSETVPHILNLFLNKLLLLLLDHKLPVSVVLEAQVVKVLHKLLRDVLEAFEATREQEECLDVIVSSLGNCPLQRGYLFIY